MRAVGLHRSDAKAPAPVRSLSPLGLFLSPVIAFVYIREHFMSSFQYQTLRVFGVFRQNFTGPKSAAEACVRDALLAPRARLRERGWAPAFGDARRR